MTHKTTTADLPEGLRILVTASREWCNDLPTREMFRRALLDEFEHVAGYVELDEVTVVHGAQGVYDRQTQKLTSGGDCMALATAAGIATYDRSNLLVA